MGDYAEDRLRSLYPEVFGGRPRRRFHVPAPKPQELPIVRVGDWRFRGWSNGEIYVFAKGEQIRQGGERITRSRQSRAFMKGYPRELETTPGLTVERLHELAELWMRREGHL